MALGLVSNQIAIKTRVGVSEKISRLSTSLNQRTFVLELVGRIGGNLPRMLLIERLGGGMLGLLWEGRSLHVVWYHARLKWSLGSVEGGSRGDGKQIHGLGIAESVRPWILGGIHWQGGVVHDCVAMGDWPWAKQGLS